MESTHSTAADFTDAAVVTRFWRNVRIGSPYECWPWTGYTNKDGYGEFHYRRDMRGAHELALSFTTGEAKHPDLDTCHSCDNPPCCNPAHLRFGTRTSNVHEMRDRGRGRNGSTRLTAEAVKEMRERRANGASQAVLAADYGITNGQVSMIVRGLRWKAAGGPIESKQAQYRKAS